MIRNRTKLIITSITTAFAGLLSIASTMAWFARANFVNTTGETGIEGSVLSGYFHDGEGTKENPFTITTPWHYENFIRLHYEGENFAEKGYYFQFGDTEHIPTDPEHPDQPVFFAVDPDSGQVLTDQYSYVLDLRGREYPPLGDEDKPFIGHLDGSNLTVKNFVVAGQDYYDIGIFGYVACPGAEATDDQGNPIGASIHNAYFSEYTIDTSAASDLLTHKNPTASATHIDEGSTVNKANTGYLIGHLVYSSSVEDVYCNSCTMEGKGSSATTEGNKIPVESNYGYYGKVEIAGQGGHIGPGSNYDFTFDTEAVYDYMSANYNNIYNNPMRARNTEYVNELVHDNEFNPDNSTKTPLNGGIRYITSGLNSYNLIGDDPDDYSATNPYTGYNYSLSTLGYQPLSAESKTFTYTAVREDTHETPPHDVVVTDESGVEKSYVVSVSDKSYAETMVTNDTFSGYNIGYDKVNNNWEYFHIETEPVDPRTGGTITISITEPIRMTCSGINLSQSLDDDGTVASLYIDQQYYSVNASEFSYTYGAEGTHGLFRLPRDPYLQINSFSKTISNLTLGIGTHHVALVFNHISSSNTQCRNIWIAYANNVTTSPSTNTGTINVTPKGFELDQHAKDNFSYSWNIDSNSVIKSYYGNVGRNCNDIAVSSQPFSDGDKKPYIISDGWTKKLIGYDEATDTYHELDSADFKFSYDNGFEEELLKLKYDQETGAIVYDEATGFPIGIKVYEDGRTEDYVPQDASEIVYGEDESGNPIPINILISTQVRDPKWVATREAPKALLMHDIVDVAGDGICDVCEQTYIPGETSHPDKPIFIADDPTLTESGYDADNIDVVGGGFQFSSTFVTIDGEDNRALTTPITSADLGKKWYATQHAPNSIVLYLSNVGGLNATDLMGHIEFDYAWTTSGGYIQSNFKSMVFKKGGTTRQNGYVYINDQLSMETGDYEEVSRSLLETTVKINLRRGIVKKCAYAALDKNGNILCGYDANGNQIASTAAINENDIKTYVLLVGVKNNITWLNINTRIQEIRFSYLAPKGFGGSFGPVEYRSVGYTVDQTILNFYYIVPDNDKYKVLVTYTPNGASRGRYDITFLYYDSTNSGKTLEVLFYLYDIVNYEVYCNSTRVAETGNGKVNITSSTW